MKLNIHSETQLSLIKLQLFRIKLNMFSRCDDTVVV